MRNTFNNLKNITKGSIILVILVTFPYLLFSHYLFSDLDFWNLKIYDGADVKFTNYQDFIENVFSNFVPLIFLIIWFISCKNWWYLGIIIPIFIYLIKLITLLISRGEFIEAPEFIYSIPITTIIIVILYFQRLKINIYFEAYDLKKAEIKEGLKKNN